MDPWMLLWTVISWAFVGASLVGLGLCIPLGLPALYRAERDRWAEYTVARQEYDAGLTPERVTKKRQCVRCGRDCGDDVSTCWEGSCRGAEICVKTTVERVRPTPPFTWFRFPQEQQHVQTQRQQRSIAALEKQLQLAKHEDTA